MARGEWELMKQVDKDRQEMERLRPELRRLTRENRESFAKSYITIEQQTIKPLEGWRP